MKIVNPVGRLIPEPTTRVSEYMVSVLPEVNVNFRHYVVEVAYRGGDLWAVLNGGFCLGSGGQWKREDEWLASHRFPLEQALELAQRVAPAVEVNGIPAEAVLARLHQRTSAAGHYVAPGRES